MPGPSTPSDKFQITLHLACISCQLSGACTDCFWASCRVERELKKWEPEGLLANMSLDAPAGKGGRTGHWDQFEANRKMFQV